MLSYDLFKKYCFFQLFLSFFRALTALAALFLNASFLMFLFLSFQDPW